MKEGFLEKLAGVLVVAVLLLGAIQVEITLHEGAHALVGLLRTGVPPVEVFLHPFAGMVVHPATRHGEPWSVAAGPLVDFVLAIVLPLLAWRLPRRRGLLLLLGSGAVAALGRFVLPLGFSDLHHLARIWGVPRLPWAIGWLFPVVAATWLAVGIGGGRRFLEEAGLAEGPPARRLAMGGTALALLVGVPLGMLDPLAVQGTPLAAVGRLVLPAWIAFLAIVSLAAFALPRGVRRWTLAWTSGLAALTVLAALLGSPMPGSDGRPLDPVIERAKAAERTGDWEAAARAWAEAYDISPQAIFAVKSARALARLGRWADAEEASRWAYASAVGDGQEAVARTWWGVALHEQGRDEEACAQLRAAAPLFRVEPSPGNDLYPSPCMLVTEIPGCTLPPPPPPETPADRE